VNPTSSNGEVVPRSIRSPRAFRVFGCWLPPAEGERFGPLTQLHSLDPLAPHFNRLNDIRLGNEETKRGAHTTYDNMIARRIKRIFFQAFVTVS